MTTGSTKYSKHAFYYVSCYQSQFRIGKDFTVALLQRPDTTVAAGVRRHTASAAILNGLPTSLDIIIVNESIAHSATSVTQTSSESLRDHLNTDRIGPVLLFQAFKPLLRASKRGNPVFLATSTVVGSIGGQEALTGLPPVLSPYGASRAALKWLVRRLHYEEPWLTAHVTHPGLVLTDMASDMFGTPEQAAAMGAITVDVSVAGVLKTLDQADREMGDFFQNYDGTTLPW